MSDADLLPIAERVRSVRWLRVSIAIAVLAAGLPVGTTLNVNPAVLVATTVLYVAGMLTVEQLWRGGRRLLGLTLLVDGLYLAWAAAATGGVGSIVPFLVVLHVTGVTLVVSYRTGLKITLWHALLIYGSYQLHAIGILEAAGLGEQSFTWVTIYIAVLGLIAMSTATFSAINERELRRQRADLQALAAVAAELETAEDPGTVAQILADRLRGTFGFPRVAVVGGDHGSAVLATAGMSSAHAGLPPAGSDSVLRRAASEGTVLVSHLVAADDPGLVALLPAARNVLVVPLVGEGGAMGAIVAEHGLRRGTRIERRVVTAVERIADHGALALRAARLLKELRTQASVDGLTGTANRRSFDEALPTELSRALRSNGHVALLMLDIDRFKAVNDTYGHQVGDDVLRGVAATLMANSRDFDTVARYGGEEFAVIVPDSDASGALATAERLRGAVEHANATVAVTVSIGVAIAPIHADDPEGLVRAADEALKVSKRQGRNRVTLAGEASSAASASLLPWLAALA